MDDKRIDQSFNIWSAHREWLEQMAEEFDLPDVDKALRVVLEYAIQDGDKDEIFSEIRCHHCG